jgi:anti-sigma factor RsiW
MKCGEIEEILAGYLDGALTPEERREVEGHLTGCRECRECLDDLRGALELAGGLERITPPAGFKQDIMARVRKEAGAKKGQGFLRKLFFPIHVKIPLQAFATVFIVVMAVYLYRAVGPGLQTPGEQKAGSALSPQVQDTVVPDGEGSPAPAGHEAPTPPRERAKGVARQMRGGADEGAIAKPLSSPGPLPEQKMDSTVNASRLQTIQETAKQEQNAAEAGMAAPQKAGQESAGAGKPGPSIQKAAAPALEAREESKDASLQAAGAPGERARVEYSRRKALTGEDLGSVQSDKMQMKEEGVPPAVKVTLAVANLEEGVRSVEKILAHLHGRIVSRQMLAGRAVITAEIPGQEVADYIKKAGEIGRMEGKADAGPVSKGFVNVRTELKTYPE